MDLQFLVKFYNIKFNKIFKLFHDRVILKGTPDECKCAQRRQNG